MPVDHDFVRCEPNDPLRCQSSGAKGQCPYKALPNSQYCLRHDALGQQLSARKAANQFRLGQYQARVTEFAAHDELKNLRGELGILRMVLEETINCTGGDKAKLLSYSGKINDNVMKISTLIRTIQSLDVKLGVMLDRDKVMLIGQRMVDIISEHITDSAALDAISEKIICAIVEISNPNSVKDAI